jgi:hypothetical protein
MASTTIVLLLTVSASAQSSSSWKEAYLKVARLIK